MYTYAGISVNINYSLFILNFVYINSMTWEKISSLPIMYSTIFIPVQMNEPAIQSDVGVNILQLTHVYMDMTDLG